MAKKKSTVSKKVSAIGKRRATPIAPNPIRLPADEALRQVISTHQETLYRAHGVLTCAYEYLEQDSGNDPDAARYAMEAVLPSLLQFAGRMELSDLKRQAEVFADQEAAAEGEEA